MLFYSLLILSIFILLFQISHSIKPKSPLTIRPDDWQIKIDSNTIKLSGWIILHNPHKRFEVMIPDLKINTKILSKISIKKIEEDINIKSFHLDQEEREDNYWEAYIIKSNNYKRLRVEIKGNGVKIKGAP